MIETILGNNSGHMHCFPEIVKNMEYRLRYVAVYVDLDVLQEICNYLE